VIFFDTANAYSTSEACIGQAIAGRREELIIATKSAARDGETVRQHLSLSLEQLGVEAIDLYQLHNVSSMEQYEKTLAPGGPLETARKARAAGEVNHIGITSHSMEVALEAVRSGHFETIMFPFNFVIDEAAEELIPLAIQRDVGFIAMKPMGGGILENATLAFKYLRRFPEIVPIVGIERAEEIDEIAAIMDGPAEMSVAEEEEMARLRAELGTRFCRRCGYCQPCPEDIPIQVLMILDSLVKRMPLEQLRSGWVGQAVKAAENCTKCGECEEKCPYGLPIRQMMDERIALWREIQ
jgi:predicted aldo/keto reductase-like oxidoreductase